MRALIVVYAFSAPVAFALIVSRSPLLATAILVSSHLMLLYPTLRPNVGWFGPVLTRFPANANEVWLTIDDGPADDSQVILDLMDDRGVKATFFLKGNQPGTAAIAARGHEVANHSWSHPSARFWCMEATEIANQIDHGVASRLFRAPVGMKNAAVHPLLARRGMTLTGWSVRTFDGVRGDAGAVVSRVTRSLAPGTIVVLHQGRPWSATVIAGVIDAVLASGYTFVIPSGRRTDSC
jgi:peptidoglycan/xylan/chitin deacetylase (PgdA/CDA1 family)